MQFATEGPEEGEDDAENGRENGSMPGRLVLEGSIEPKRSKLNRNMTKYNRSRQIGPFLMPTHGNHHKSPKKFRAGWT